MAAVIESIAKPALDFKPAGVPIGPAGIGMVVAGAANGVTTLAIQQFKLGGGMAEQQKRAVAAGVLGLEAWALLKFKPVSRFMGAAAGPAALFLAGAALNHLIGALRADRPVPDLVGESQNMVLRVLGGIPGVGKGLASHHLAFNPGNGKVIEGTVVRGRASMTGA